MKPEDCPHILVNRVIDSWKCNECGAEFIPKDKKHRTKWRSFQPCT
jgi:hypothetical protein